jgi:hypothetical protein
MGMDAFLKLSADIRFIRADTQSIHQSLVDKAKVSMG